ncbi:MAG: RidA family protein [Pseudomonadota bacterium]
MKRQVIIPEGMENIHETYHYAPGILIGDTLYLSGQVGRDADLKVVEGTEAQFVQAFENVGKVLAVAGATFADVVELETWFTESMADLKTFLAVKDRYFTAPPYPTWTGFAVKGFSMPGILVEIKCKAILGLGS